MDKTSRPYTFQPDICRFFSCFSKLLISIEYYDLFFINKPIIQRSVYEVYNETSLLTSQQIEANGYILDASIFNNVTLNPDNVGFCTPTADNCLITGILNVTTCSKSKENLFFNCLSSL